MTKKALLYSPELAGVRGLAAVLVCFYHYAEYVQPLQHNASVVSRMLASVSTHDYITVDVFFVLSGFLISSLLLVDKEKPHFFYNFYWRRALRILPVFFLTILMLIHADPGMGRYILLCFFLVSNFSTALGIDFLSPIWTLSIEEQFYLLWPHVIRRCAVATIMWIAISLIILSTSLRWLFCALHDPVNIGYTCFRLDGFGFGVLLACVYTRGSEMTPRLRQVMNALTSSALLYVATAIFLIICVLPQVSLYVEYLMNISYSNFMMFRFVNAVTLKGRRSRFLASRPMVFLGSISYAFYMFHFFIIHHFEVHWGPPNPLHGWSFIGRMLLIYGITIVASTASRYLVEKPAQKLRRFILARPADIKVSLALESSPEAARQRTLT